MLNRFTTVISHLYLSLCISLFTLFAFQSSADAQNAQLNKRAVKEMEEASSDLTEQDEKMLEVANSLAAECTAILKKWVSSKEISKDKLFSYLYYPIENTDPPTFHTDYDQLSDRDIQTVLEKHLNKEPDTIYAVLADKNGYVPTHNLKYSKPLTGNRAKDLAGNRTKRIYADKAGLIAARNREPYVLQVYRRDTGQVMADLSVPVKINGKVWGNIRLGYLKTSK